MEVAEGILRAVTLWLYVGAAVASIFLTVGIDRIDEDARGAYVFRVLLIPGILLLWPLVLWRWWVLETDRDNWALRHAPPRKSHGPVWVVLAIVIVITLATALALRPTWPGDVEPIQLSGAPE